MKSIHHQAHLDHLVAIHQRLSNEHARLEAATTTREREFRVREVATAKKELASHYEFLGMTPTPEIDAMDEDELLAALFA